MQIDGLTLKLAAQVIEAAKKYIEAADKSTAELGAPDMTLEEKEAFLYLKDRVFLYEGTTGLNFCEYGE